MRDVVREQVALSQKVDKDRVVVDHLRSTFGKGVTSGYVKVYSTKKTALAVEAEPLIKRNQLMTAAMKAEAKKADAEKAEAKKADAERAEARKAELEKADAEKADAEKADAEKADVERADAEKADAAKADEEPAACLRKECPKCGPGVFMAEHPDRVACGKCGYTEFKGS